VAKEVMAIKYSNKTGHSITNFLESPFASKHPKAAAAEVAVTAAEVIAVADLEEAKRLAAEFEAMGGGALTMALAGVRARGHLARVLTRTRATPHVGGPLDQSREILDGPHGRCRRGG
jgi:hypothetical protein